SPWHLLPGYGHWCSCQLQQRGGNFGESIPSGSLPLSGVCRWIDSCLLFVPLRWPSIFQSSMKEFHILAVTIFTSERCCYRGNNFCTFTVCPTLISHPY